MSKIPLPDLLVGISLTFVTLMLICWFAPTLGLTSASDNMNDVCIGKWNSVANSDTNSSCFVFYNDNIGYYKSNDILYFTWSKATGDRYLIKYVDGNTDIITFVSDSMYHRLYLNSNTDYDNHVYYKMEIT